MGCRALAVSSLIGLLACSGSPRNAGGTEGVAATPTRPAPKSTPAPEPNLLAQRWKDEVPPTPSRIDPPPTSILGQLSERDVAALVVNESGLELVNVDTNSRRQLASGRIAHAAFEPGTGLVFFYRDASVWAIDLREPLAGELPEVVELARVPAKQAERLPDQVILCFDTDGPFWGCWPHSILPSDWDTPEYIGVYWGDDPHATWHEPTDYNSDDFINRPLELLAADWLNARADRRQHFSQFTPHSHYVAPPLHNPPKFGPGCTSPEDCGQSVPLGVSGWEWVLVDMSMGDLSHFEFAVYESPTRRWAEWRTIVEGTPKWIAADAITPAKFEEIADEVTVRFDGSGRVFASPYPSKQLCQFVYAADSPIAQGVRCEDAGGTVVAFLSVPVLLGD